MKDMGNVQTISQCHLNDFSSTTWTIATEHTLFSGVHRCFSKEEYIIELIMKLEFFFYICNLAFYSYENDFKSIFQRVKIAWHDYARAKTVSFLIFTRW